MEHDAPRPTKQLYAFLRAIEQLAEIVAFRQPATDTYDFFGRRISETGVESYLFSVNARVGFRDIMIALAYLNFAIAIRQNSPDPGNVQRGFWSLGARWYPPLLMLHSHTTPIVFDT